MIVLMDNTGRESMKYRSQYPRFLGTSSVLITEQKNNYGTQFYANKRQFVVLHPELGENLPLFFRILRMVADQHPMIPPPE